MVRAGEIVLFRGAGPLTLKEEENLKDFWGVMAGLLTKSAWGFLSSRRSPV